MNKSYKLSPYFILLSFLLIIGSCLDPIELDIPKGQDEALVINAKIIKSDPSIFELNLSQIFTFTSESRGRIIAKNVIITDEAGNSLEVDPTADGVYYHEFQDSDPISIEIGQSYKLTLRTFDGRDFETNFEPLLPVPEIDQLSYEIKEKTFFIPDGSERTATNVEYKIGTSLTAPSQDSPSFLKWEMERVYKVTDSPIIPARQPKVCYVTNNAGVFDINIYNGQTTTEQRLDNFDLYDEFLDRNYGEGLYFTVIQESLSKTAFEYWEKVRSILERKDNIYADPPGRIQSNFVHTNGSEEAYGYFYVTVQDTARIYLDPELTGIETTRCPSDDLINMDGSCGDPLCCDCLSVDNSSSIKPSFWTE